MPLSPLGYVLLGLALGLLPALWLAWRQIRQRHRLHEILAQHDSLTRLPNRSQLLQRLRACLAEQPQPPRVGALLILNVDHMQRINDSLGQHVGDHRLQQVAKVLAGSTGPGDLVARLGGDEFALLVPDLAVPPAEAAGKAGTIARHLLQALARPSRLAGERHEGSVSIGIALFSGVGETLEMVLRHADVALSQAKSSGRNTSSLYHPEMPAVLAARAGLEADLKQAITEGQFVLHYQPQVDQHGQLLGYEALIRWNHPRRGQLPPSRFLPLAEASGLILPLGDWVLQQACQQVARWAAEPASEPLMLAVNISPLQLRQPDFLESLLHHLEATGARPQRLELELTENHLLEDVDACVHTLRQLRTLGVRISLDDFGTGYSSLNYLKQLPLDQVKIDQSFVRDLEHDANDMAIVRTIVSLAGCLGLQVLAEGVENANQRQMLLELGCQRFQGTWVGPPRPLPIAA